MPIHYTTLDLDPEIAVAIHYTIIPYIPEQGPSYACGGQPAEGGYAEIEKIVDEDGAEVTLTDKQIEYYEEWLYSNEGDYE